VSDIVLVHDAFHGGWCWRRVVPLLAARGHRVLCPTLTGLGERRHLLTPETTLDTHIDDIANSMLFEEIQGAVLVCHSYGGMPATGAADRLSERIAAMVWLDAYVPEDGLSALDLRDRHSNTIPLPPHEGAVIAPLPASAFGVTGDDAAWLEALLTPQPLASVTQPIRLSGAWRAIPIRHYHRATRYSAGYFDAMADAAEEDGGWLVARRDMAHDMMVTEPEWTAAAILAALPG
jgi:pimeloyl-ACP methyl ester carboxylesterase